MADCIRTLKGIFGVRCGACGRIGQPPEIGDNLTRPIFSMRGIAVYATLCYAASKVSFAAFLISYFLLRNQNAEISSMKSNAIAGFRSYDQHH